MYEIWPPGSPGCVDGSVSLVLIGPSGPDWKKSDWGEVQATVGAALPALPAHDELYRRVGDLGGGILSESVRPVFEALPMAHYARFKQMAQDANDSGGMRGAARPAVGRAFVASLTPDDLRACRFHDGDWRAVADESVRILEQIGPNQRAGYRAAAGRSGLPDRERRWLMSLFADPVDIHGDSYVSGQHRGCALRFCGAERAAVVTHWESLGEERECWVYEGGG